MNIMNFEGIYVNLSCIKKTNKFLNFRYLTILVILEGIVNLSLTTCPDHTLQVSYFTAIKYIIIRNIITLF